MEGFDRFFWKFQQRLVYVSSFLMMVQMGYVFVNVVARYVFNFPIFRTMEIVGMLMVPITFFSAAWGWRLRGTFVRVDIVTSHLKPKALNKLERVYSCITLLTYVLILGITSGMHTVWAYNVGDYIGGFTAAVVSWPFRLCMFIGLILMGISILLGLRHQFKGGTLYDPPAGMK